MKYLPTALALVCLVLVIALIVTKRSGDAQHETDAGAMTDLSNTLVAAQAQIAVGNTAMLTWSNNLDECRSASLACSNRLTEAESAVALDAEQITNLNRQLADLASEIQTLQASARRIVDLTNQVATLTAQIASTKTSLAQANKDYALLENRLRRDVAERLVVERKFNNLSELQAQMKNLKQHPAGEISAEGIYAGLDVEVKSNTFHVIAPN
jgi:chromosome segregation ATPase